MGSFLGKRKHPIRYDPARQQPAVRRSICTGEMTAGLVDRESGKFHELMLLQTQEELEEFCARTGIRREDLPILY